MTLIFDDLWKTDRYIRHRNRCIYCLKGRARCNVDGDWAHKRCMPKKMRKDYDTAQKRRKEPKP
jgi:hypothetical protein